MSGAFNSLEAIVKKRLNRQGIGFGADIQQKDEQTEYLRHLKAEDLIQYGFESEFIGRLPVVTVFEPLEAEDLYKILRNPKSPIIIGKKRDFKAYGIDLHFEDKALRKIAENACRERTGARGLVSAAERVLMKFEHTLPSTHIHHLIVTSDMVDNPDGELHKILIHPDDPEREAAFQYLLTEEEACLERYIRDKLHDWQKSYGTNFSDARIKLIIRHTLEQQTDMEVTIEEIQAIQQVVQDFTTKFSTRNELEISFTDEAIDCLAEKIWKEPQDLSAYLRLALQNYDHGLKLIREKTGKRQFIIPVEGVENPEQFLNGLIQEAYRKT